MTKDNTTKILIMLVLIVLATGITIVFATFSSSLNISSIKGTAQQGDNDVNFQNKVTFQNDAKCTTTGDAYVTSAGTATGSSWSGIDITAKSPGDTITCTATIKNSSNYTAYLTNLSTTNDKGVSCSSKGATTASAATTACRYIVGHLRILSGDIALRNNGSDLNSASGSLEPNKTTVATFSITVSNSLTLPDDDIVVSIADMTATFSTVSN